MARDDERFFEENEDMEQEEEQEQYDDEAYEEEQYEDEYDEEGTELDRLLDFLVKALEQGSQVPLSNKRMVNVEMCKSIVDDIRDCLPDAVRYAQQIVDNQYPCGDGGWIHFRVTAPEHMEDIQVLLTAKIKK